MNINNNMTNDMVQKDEVYFNDCLLVQWNSSMPKV